MFYLRDPLLALQLLLSMLARLITSSASCDDGNHAYAGLTTVPPHQPGCDQLRLILTGNFIVVFPSGALQGYSYLRVLIVPNSQVSIVEEGAFDGGIHLERVDLSYNDIQYLNNSFKNAAFQEVNLEHNEIQRLDANSFRGATALEHINLASNQISNVNDSTFSWVHELRTLNMADNDIETLGESLFAENPKLVTVYLQNNRLSFLPAGLFDNLDYLTYVKLSDNRLSSISFIFTSPSVVLYADNCGLTELPDVKFRGSGGAVIEMDLRENMVQCDCYTLEMTLTSNRTLRCIDEDTGAYSIATCFNKEVTTVSNTDSDEDNQSTAKMGVQEEHNEDDDNARSLSFLFLIIPFVMILIVVLAGLFVRRRCRIERERVPDDEDV